jgi:hypothetical protein
MMIQVAGYRPIGAALVVAAAPVPSGRDMRENMVAVMLFTTLLTSMLAAL